MSTKRVKRLNSLLREVISDVIRKEVRNPHVSLLTTVTKVDISSDLRHAEVSISVIGSDAERAKTVAALNTTATSGYISTQAAKEVVLRYFPSLTFKLDTSVDKHMRIDSVLKEIEEKKNSRNSHLKGET
ncbi:MAG: 30S ribosome-binding factor RbfA [Chlamydiota bacterium]